MTRAFSRHLLLTALLAGLAVSPTRVGADEPAGKLPRSAERWVERALKRMTLEEKIGQLLMVDYFGAYAHADSDEFQRLARRVQKLHVGGFVVHTRPRRPSGFERSELVALAQLTNRLQRLASVPLVVSADFERGAGYRVRETTGFPHNMTLGAAGDPALAREMGRIAAMEARALGIHWLLAPVADVNNNPLNPIINMRSFGEDPVQVARMVEAFVRGCEEAGALSTAKHFPGAGDLALDPHLVLATVAADRARLDQIELAPFRAAIAAGVSAVMTEHIAVPALEPDRELPATFSRAITTDLLRGELGFDGLIITDAMNMSAITANYWTGEAAVRAVEAGADVILMSPEPEVAFAALKRAVASGRLSEKRIEESVQRLLRAKARLDLHRETEVSVDALEKVVTHPLSLARAQEAADRGTVLLRDNARLLPIDSTKPQRGFLLVVSADPDEFPGAVLERELRPRVDSLLVTRTDRLFFKPEEVTLPAPALYDWSILAVSVRIADRKGNVALPPNLAALADRVLEGGKPAILVVLGSPYLAERFPNVPTVLCVFSTAEVSERAAVRALFGEIVIGGKLPVTIPGVAKLGDGLQRPAFPMTLAAGAAEDEQGLAPAFRVLESGVEQGVFPGGVLAVGHRGRLLTVHPFGKTTYDEKGKPVATDTLYDLASLTKVVGTTTAAMMLYERGQLPLEEPVARYLPELTRGLNGQPGKSEIQVRHLLTHSSGLTGYLRLFVEVSDGREQRGAEQKQQLLDRLYGLGLEYPTGTRSVYSDLGVILLGETIQRVSGQPLDVFLGENLFAPLGMSETQFGLPPPARERAAPTEDDREFRKRLIRGEVHDENAWVMGGVSSHAGLFSTARDLAAFCQMLLNGGVYGHKRLLQRSTIELFTARQPIPDSTRALGWDTPSEGSSGGRHLSARAFGHTGFTGTSIWIDPEKELFIVLLTNRVHPTRANDKIRAFRPRLHDAVIESLGLAPPPPLEPAGNR